MEPLQRVTALATLRGFTAPECGWYVVPTGNRGRARAKSDDKGEILFYDVRPLGIEGQGWSDVESPFDRLPGKAKDVVRPAVWKLSHHSAGLAVRFSTDVDKRNRVL